MFVFDHPQQPPEIVAAHIAKEDNTEQRFLHLNFDEDGQVCTSDQTGQQNSKAKTLIDLLIDLEYMIYFPNIESAFPSPLY
jgi:ubiquitin-protein ligase